MWEFIKRNWVILLVGFLSLATGFLLQLYANYRSEQRIIKAIIAEMNTLQQKQSGGRSTGSDQQRLIELQAQLDILT